MLKLLYICISWYLA